MTSNGFPEQRALTIASPQNFTQYLMNSAEIPPRAENSTERPPNPALIQFRSDVKIDA
jgi:hypothetical protein